MAPTATIGFAALQIVPSMRGVASSLTKQLDQSGAADKAGRRVGLRFSGALTQHLRVGAAVATTALGAVGVAAAAVGLKTAAAMEQADISFTTMLGSAAKARKFLGDLQKFAAATPFSFPELQQAASSLVSAGIAAQDVIPIMTTLGDVTSGMGTGSEGIQRATIALQQMNAAGKITGEDLNQLRDAGIPVYDLLANATGKTKAQVVALAQAGKLGHKELDQMMTALKTGGGLERFSGLMEKQSQSLSGLWSSLQDNVQMALANMAKGFFPIIKTAMPAIIDLTGKIGPAVSAMAQQAGAGLSGLINQAGPVLATLQRYAAQAAHGFSLTADQVAGLGEPLSRFAVVGFQAKQALRAVGDAASHLAAGFTLPRDTARALAGQMTGLLAVGSGLRDTFDTTWTRLGSIFGKLRDTAVALAPAVLSIAKSLAQASASLGISTLHIAAATWDLLLSTLDALASVLNAVLVPALTAVADWMGRNHTAVTAILATYTAYRLAVVATTAATAGLNAATRILTALQKAQQSGGLLAWLKRLVLESKLAAAATKAQAAAVAAWTVAVDVAKYLQVAGYLAAVRVQTIAMSVASKAAAAAQWLLNLAMRANPIGLILTGLVALGAGLVIAYQKSSTFRAIVQAAFGAVLAAGKALVGWFGTGLSAVKTALTAVGNAATWLYRNAIRPAFDAIAFAGKLLAVIIGTVVLTPMLLAFRVLSAMVKTMWRGAFEPAFKGIGAAATWLWRKAIEPALDGIAAATRWLYGNVIRPTFDLFVAALRALGAAATWLWQKAMVPAYNGIAAGLRWLVNTVVRPTAALFVAALKLVGQWATWLWRNVIVPAWNGITSAITTAKNKVLAVLGALVGYIRGGLASAFRWFRDTIVTPVMAAIRTTIRAAYDKGIKPAFDLVSKGVGAVGRAFAAARDAIKTAWNAVANIARAPINFVISTVYNSGVVDTFNSLARAVGIKQRLTKLKPLKAYASGGVIPGPVSATDNTLAHVRSGEAVMVPEWVRAVGGAAGVAALNASAQRGALPHFKDGGVVGKVTGAIGGVGGFLKDKAQAAWDFVSDAPGVMRKLLSSAVGGLVDRIPGSGFIHDAAKAIPGMVIDSLVGAAKRLAGAVSGALPGGGGLGQGVPGSSKLGTYQGKTFTQAMISRIIAAERRYGSAFHISQGGFRPSTYYSGSTHNGDAVDIGSPWNARVVAALRASGIVAWMRTPSQGPWARHIHGIPVPGGGVRPSPSAVAQYRSFLRGGNGLGGYRNGGWLMPGQVGVNETRSPEAVFNRQQWRILRAAVEPHLAGGAAAGQGDTFTFNMRSVDLNERTFTSVQRAARLRQRAGRPS